MLPKTTSISTRQAGSIRQAGYGLIESLVSIVFVGLILSCSVYGLTRGSRIQYTNNMRGQIVDTLRSKLMDQGVSLCGSTLPITLGTQSVNAKISCEAYSGVSATFEGVATPVAFSVPPEQAQMINATLSSAIIGGQLSVSSHMAGDDD